MPEDKKEPQSYGSDRDWLTGDVGQEVNRQKGNPNSQHGDFYESRRDSEGNAPHQGGHAPAESNAADTGAAREDDVAPPPKVTDQEGGAKRESYFKKRDYE